jgi:hypothetical protein
MGPKLVVEAESIRTTNSQSIFGKVYLAEEPTTYFPGEIFRIFRVCPRFFPIFSVVWRRLRVR